MSVRARKVALEQGELMHTAIAAIWGLLNLFNVV